MSKKNYNNDNPHPINANIRTPNHWGVLVKSKINKDKKIRIMSVSLFKEDRIIGSYNAAISKPITLAFTAFKEPLMILIFLNSSQIGNVPITNRKDGKNIKNKQNIPINHELNPLWINVPKYAEKVNNGPGIAWAAPYPAKKVSSFINPDDTNSTCNKGKTTCPPPKTKEPIL